MTTATARYERTVRDEFSTWQRMYSDVTLTITTHRASGNRLTCKIAPIGSPLSYGLTIFSMHKRQHKQFHAIVKQLRGVLDQMVQLAASLKPPTVPLLSNVCASTASERQAAVYREMCPDPVRSIMTSIPVSLISRKAVPPRTNGAPSMVWCDNCCGIVPGTNGKCGRCTNEMLERSRQMAINVGNTNLTVKAGWL